MNSKAIREMFLSYFEDKGYLRADSASLVPAGDPSLLFTNAGMVPFKDYFLGLEQPPSLKMTTSQKCVRAGGKHNDLDQVGLTARHHTFFEMLGNFVFQGAKKEVAIREAWELITEHYQIPKEKLWVTVFHDDEESRRIWIDDIGVAEDRVIKCGEEDNFWSMGDVGPCGPCTEIFYDHGEDIAGGPPGSEDAEGDRYTEIWNLVFMQYEMQPDGNRVELKSMGLDTGMGIERLAAVMQRVHNNFDSDLFTPIINKINEFGDMDITSARVIADHIRSSVFLVCDQVHPSNEGRGYVLRRIIRRAMGFAYRCGVKEPFFHKLVDVVLNIMGDAYPAIIDGKDVITQVIKDEELRFHTTIEQGMKILQSYIDESRDIDGKTAFMMYDTYGFPLDIASDIAKKYGLSVDESGYLEHMKQQQERSRKSQMFSDAGQSVISLPQVTDFTGHDYLDGESKITHLFANNIEVETLDAEGIVVVESTPFYPEGGGQIGDSGRITVGDTVFEVKDTQKSGKAIMHIGRVVSGALTTGLSAKLSVDHTRDKTMCNHSATHLLHAALREVLGSHVVQKGSLVTAERLRFDFTHSKPMTDQQIMDVETLVNDQIRRNTPKVSELVSLSDARKMNIMALFDEKYEDPVRVIRFGEFSAELCGGTHVKATGEIGMLKLISETGIASGVRRVEALTGSEAFKYVQGMKQEKSVLASLLKCDEQLIHKRVEQLLANNKQLKKAQENMMKERYQVLVKDWVENREQLAKCDLVFQTLEGASSKLLRQVLDIIKTHIKSGLIVLQVKQGEQFMLLIGSQHSDIDCGKLYKSIVATHGGKGGGSQSVAQGMIDQQLTKSQLLDLLE